MQVLNTFLLHKSNIESHSITAGNEDSVSYMASDLPKRTLLTPTLNEINDYPPPSEGVVKHGYRRDSKWVCSICNIYPTLTKMECLVKGFHFE